MQQCELQFHDHLPYNGNTWHNGQEMLCISNLMEHRRVYLSASKLKQFIADPDPTRRLSNKLVYSLIELFSGQAELHWRAKSYIVDKISLRFSSPNLRFQLQSLLASIYNQLDHSYHSVPVKCQLIIFEAPRNFPKLAVKCQPKVLNKKSARSQTKSRKFSELGDYSPPYKSTKSHSHDASDEDADSPPSKPKKARSYDEDEDSPPYNANDEKDYIPPSKAKKTRPYEASDEEDEDSPPYKTKKTRPYEASNEEDYIPPSKPIKASHYETSDEDLPPCEQDEDIIVHEWNVSLFHTEISTASRVKNWKTSTRGDAIEQFFMGWTMRKQEDSVMARLTNNSIFEPQLLKSIAAFISAQHCEWFKSLKIKHRAAEVLPAQISEIDVMRKYKPAENPLQEMSETKLRKRLIDQFDPEDVVFFTEIGNQQIGSIPLVTVKQTLTMLPTQFCNRGNNPTVPDANYIISKGKLYFYQPTPHNRPLYSEEYHTFLKLRELACFL